MPPRHSAERHWRRSFFGAGDFLDGVCRLGTQPKGIGDACWVRLRVRTMGLRAAWAPSRKALETLSRRGGCSPWPTVPRRHTAERHWRRPNGTNKGRGMGLVPPRHSAERHWRQESVTLKPESLPRVPPGHSAEKHWRRLRDTRGKCGFRQLCRLGTQPKGIGAPSRLWREGGI